MHKCIQMLLLLICQHGKINNVVECISMTSNIEVWRECTLVRDLTDSVNPQHSPEGRVGTYGLMLSNPLVQNMIYPYTHSQGPAQLCCLSY